MGNLSKVDSPNYGLLYNRLNNIKHIIQQLICNGLTTFPRFSVCRREQVKRKAFLFADSWSVSVDVMVSDNMILKANPAAGLLTYMQYCGTH